tara:strand:- start:426 stop:1340 length:915 start_codon:yes stop_codon:yes gene_type:complete
LKVKEVITEIYQSSGLWLINAIANSAPCEVERDVAYGLAARQRLDHYRLPDHESRPTVVFYFGGNWRSGNKRDYRFVADTLLAAGCNVIIPNYRLYPLVRFDQIRADASAAFAAACDRVSPGQPLYVMGHSAGAQLGALLALDDEANPLRSRISGFIGLAGPYDFYPFTDADHWDLFGPEQHYPSSQAVNYVRADAAPFYLLHGENDQRVRRGHSKSLMEKQQAMGATANREVYPGLGHVELILAFSRLHRSNSAVVRDINAFLNGNAADSDNKQLNNDLPNNDLSHNKQTKNLNLEEAANGTK